MTEFENILKEPTWFAEGGPESDVVCSSRARLSRNLSSFLFPNKLSDKESAEVQQSIQQAFQRSKYKENLRIGLLEDLPVLERRKMIERHFLSQNYSLQKERLFIRDSENTLAAVVNEGEHLKIAGFAGGLNLEEAYRRVSGIEVDLESQLDFAVSLDKGYLTSDILNCGTGLRASALLHLPALEYSSLIDRAVKKVMEAGYEIKGLTGDEDRSLGALYELYNPVAIGESEKELLERLAHMSSQLVDYERRAREEMKRHRRLELEDIVYRAWGTLAHCRLLGEKESFKLLSDIRLGVGIGWLDFPIQRINQLMILTGKAHIQGMMGDEPSDELFRQTKYGRAKLVKYALGFASG